MNYTGQDLVEIQQKYNQIWKQIRAKYPKASGSVNFALNGYFAPINESFGNLFKKNHYLFLDSEYKTKAQNLMKANKDAAEEDFKKLLLKAPLNPECRIEIIWNDLDYDLIAELQVEPLVDLNLTPQTRASIRIVLGVVGSNNK